MEPTAILVVSLTMIGSAVLGPRAAQAGIDCTPAVQWSWDGNVRAPDHAQPCISPLVVQLTDDDGDGFIDENDIPDVAFVHRRLLPTGDPDARLTAVDGLTGREHFTVVHGTGLMSGGLAAADIDGDGLVELLAIENSGTRLVAFENDGTHAWTSDATSVAFSRFDVITVADLDQDGSAEILANAAVFRADGRLAWEGSAGRGVQFLGSVCHAVDLDPTSPGLEVLAGHTLYDAAGGIIWRSRVHDGWTAVADFEGDGDPDIAHVSIGAVNLLDQQGNALAPEYSFGGTPASQPVAADLDGDGVAELFLMQQEEVRALKLVGGAWSLAWSQATQDPSRINGASAFDFDGDGALDLIYHDMVSWYVFDGPTGAILHEESFPSATGIETPVIADIDNDCLTEILVTGCAGALGAPYRNEVVAYECAPALRARPVWNQYAYHVNNVLDDGSVPQFEQPAWLDHGSWLAQVATAAGSIPTAAASTPLRTCAGQAVTLDGSLSTGCTGGYEYRFAEGTTPIRPWSSDPTHQVTPTASPTAYTLHVRCAGEPCEARAEILVEVDPAPLADAGPSHLVCVGSATQLGGSPTGSGGAGGFSYLWESSPPGLIVVGEETLSHPRTGALFVPTQFTVTVTDARGCTDTASVLIDVHVPDAPRSIGSTLRVVKGPTDRDVVLRWSTTDVETVAFRLRRGWQPASSYPVSGPDVVTPTLADFGVLHDGRNHAYLVSGVNCAGVEGP